MIRDGCTPPDRAAYGVLDTLRSVCLLRSRSKTFLYFDKFVKEVIYFRNRLGSFSVITVIHGGSN